jgi:hypothetical protein
MRITRFVLEEGRFDLGTIFEHDDRIRSTVLPDIDAPVSSLVSLDE